MKASKKEKILTEYLNKEISMTKLALKHKVNRNTITTWLKKNGLRNKYDKMEFLDKKEIIRLYVVERMSCEEIASQFNVSVRPIKNILKKYRDGKEYLSLKEVQRLYLKSRLIQKDI